MYSVKYLVKQLIKYLEKYFEKILNEIRKNSKLNFLKQRKKQYILITYSKEGKHVNEKKQCF